MACTTTTLSSSVYGSPPMQYTLYGEPVTQAVALDRQLQEIQRLKQRFYDTTTDPEPCERKHECDVIQRMSEAYREFCGA